MTDLEEEVSVDLTRDGVSDIKLSRNNGGYDVYVSIRFVVGLVSGLVCGLTGWYML